VTCGRVRLAQLRVVCLSPYFLWNAACRCRLAPGCTAGGRLSTWPPCLAAAPGGSAISAAAAIPPMAYLTLTQF